MEEMAANLLNLSLRMHIATILQREGDIIADDIALETFVTNIDPATMMKIAKEAGVKIDVEKYLNQKIGSICKTDLDLDLETGDKREVRI